MNDTIAYVDNRGEEYPSCPLRSDLNSCAVVKGSNINDCPSLDKDGVWSVPNMCPLRNGSVCARFIEE